MNPSQAKVFRSFFLLRMGLYGSVPFLTREYTRWCAQVNTKSIRVVSKASFKEFSYVSQVVLMVMTRLVLQEIKDLCVPAQE